MLNILILGGSGILSTSVAQEAVNRGYNVTCLTTGRRDNMLPKGVKSIHGNANEPNTFIPLLDEYYDSIVDFLSYNVQQLNPKLEKLLAHTEQYIFVSSATAYKIIDEEITEDTPLGNQYWDYSENKVMCEKILVEKCADVKKKYTIIRPYITYGNTRLPFGIISERYWSLANRILCNKPVLLWDNGEAVCTLTHTSDFARGVVSLFGNKQAFNQAYHVTSSERLTWKEVLHKTAKALGKQEIIFSAETNDILDYLPEYTGILTGDKGRNRIFNNTKICDIAPEFQNYKAFEDGIKETVDYFNNNDFIRVVDYVWDGRIDATIIKLSKDKGEKIDRAQLKYQAYEHRNHLKNIIKYYIGRYDVLYLLYTIRSVKNKKEYIRQILKKDNSKTVFRKRFHHFGFNVEIGKCDFGNDLEMISIGNNIKLMDGTKFITYRPSAEFFSKTVSDGTDKSIRDIGKIVIEDNVYIGTDVKIYPNVTIGKNSMILDGSVVFDSIPSDSLAGGNPAKVLCSINEWYNKICDQNKKYPWYGKNYSHEKIVEEREKYFFED